MVSRKDFPKDEVEAARAVLIELTHVLAAYRADIVLVGGWVPEMLFSNKSAPHVGSLDVDLAVNHLHLTEEHYRTIRELLLARGYSPGNSRSFSFGRFQPPPARSRFKSISWRASTRARRPPTATSGCRT